MKHNNTGKIISTIISELLVNAALPAGLFALVWNNYLADAFNASHFSYWLFLMVCIGIRYLIGK